jgi:hypothetical protein
MIKILGWTEIDSVNKKNNHQIKTKRLIKGKIVICY